MQENYYDILEVSQNASPEVIKAAYRSLTKKYHPDTNNGNNIGALKLKNIIEAYELLSDPIKRSFYDIEIESKRNVKKENPTQNKEKNSDYSRTSQQNERPKAKDYTSPNNKTETSKPKENNEVKNDNSVSSELFIGLTVIVFIVVNFIAMKIGEIELIDSNLIFANVIIAGFLFWLFQKTSQ